MEKRTYNNEKGVTLIVASKFLEMFKSQPGSCFGAPTYKAWYGLNNEFKEALKLYYNCLLKVCKEIYGYKTKYEYYSWILYSNNNVCYNSDCYNILWKYYFK